MLSQLLEIVNQSKKQEDSQPLMPITDTSMKTYKHIFLQVARGGGGGGELTKEEEIFFQKSLYEGIKQKIYV